MDVVSKVVNALVEDRNVWRATCFLDNRRVVKATRKRFHGKPYPVNARGESFILSFGRPNYREREFLKQCKRAGEPLPVKKIQLQFIPVGK